LQDHLYAAVMIHVGLIYTFISVFIWLFWVENIISLLPRVPRWQHLLFFRLWFSILVTVCTVVSGWWLSRTRQQRQKMTVFWQGSWKGQLVVSSQLCLDSTKTG